MRAVADVVGRVGMAVIPASVVAVLGLSAGVGVPGDGPGAASAADESAAVYLPMAATGRSGHGEGPGVGDVLPGARLTGSWQVMEDARTPGVYAVWSDQAGASLAFDSYEEHLVVRRRVASSSGSARVSIDGVDQGVLRFDFEEERWNVPAYLDHLGTGRHAVVLTVTEDGPGHGQARVAVQRVTAEPLPVHPLAQAHVERINRYRRDLGLPDARVAAALAASLQAHADYLAANPGVGTPFEEQPGLPGFVGRSPWQRAWYFGWLGDVRPVTSSHADPRFEVDTIMPLDSRRDYLDYRTIDFGFATVAGVGNIRLMSDHRGPYPSERLLVKVPFDGQIDVPIGGNSGEGWRQGPPIQLFLVPAKDPSDLDGVQRTASATAGIAQEAAVRVDRAALVGPDGQTVPIDAVHAGSTPPELESAHVDGVPHNEVLLLPRSPLGLDGTYRVELEGLDPSGVGFSAAWSFRTLVPATAMAVGQFNDIAACGARVRWENLGPVQGTVDYGLADQYGRSAPVRLAWSDEARGVFVHEAVLTGLLPETVYHYRLHTRDDAGNERTSDDYELRTVTQRTFSVPRQATLQEALAAAKSCDVVEVAAGTYEGNFLVPDGVRLLGSGVGVTVLDGAGTGNVVHAGDGSRISGFTIRGSGPGHWDAGVWVGDTASPTIANNRIEGNSMGIAAYCFEEPCSGHPMVLNNEIVGNVRVGVAVFRLTASVLNNTILDNEVGISADRSGTEVRSTIVAGSRDVGVTAPATGTTLAYCVLWSNGRDLSEGLQAGLGSFSADPLFRSAPDDLRLGPESPCQDAGDPSDAFLDRDGTRNDIGATGGPGASPGG